ncbi:anion exchange protein 2-like [Ctenocephalides felis]|uniref:anion exchange protein 2-like n=1 Tax=Ctenocephalides felis TaxID=7515 RepID=UPI000E6E4FB1|nr:anion exchange protein 2-like [Ctenocephalides felis]
MQPEDRQLEEHDQDDLVSHRSDDPRGLRRHKIQPTRSSSNSFVHIARKEEGHKLSNLLTQSTLKKLYDHSPHEVFVQLDELVGTGDDREWKETARWIKYEENVEEGSDRWGRPHVASLSFHSLLNLRRCLETGAVLLDLDEKDLPGVAYRIVEQMLVDELILEDDKPIIMRALLLRHRHVNENDRGFMFGSRRKFSSYTSLQNLSDDKGKKRDLPSSTLHIDLLTRNALGSNRRLGASETRVDMKEENTYSASQEDLYKKTHNEAILRRIPTGAEATTVLVGSVDFLDHPTIAFVRLASGVQMPTLTEVPIPVRFMFVLLGPDDSDLDYHEVGRSIATLMANRPFHQVAYKAEDRRELLSAINEFLDDSIVLPPGDWERQALLPFDEIKAKSEKIRQRRAKEAKEAALGGDKGGPGGGGDDGGDGKKGGDEKKTGGSGGKKLVRREPLEKTGKAFGGLINDMRYRFPFYISDYLDGLNSQCVAATIFMYFAALSTAITFGGLLSDKTHNLIGISETLVAASGCGIIFALIAGQPMVIIGTTGPLLLLDESLYQFCVNNDIDFLTCRLYMGFWMAITAIVVASVEGSRLVKLFTRFTEEIFSALISLIYIFESIMKLIYVFKRNPLLGDYCTLSFLTDSGNGTSDPWTMQSSNETMKLPTSDALGPINQPNTALFCLILALGTFTIAYYLRIFRNGHFLGRNARRALGDFGVPIAIVIMVTIDYLVPGTYTDKLSVPEGLSPSDPENRGWIIPLLGKDPENPFPVWAMFASVVPGVLVYILVFMETHISELIIDKPERNLKKGSGFHMDIVVICILNAVCGVMGAPWHCAATVRSVTHVAALTVMSRTHAPGEAPHIVEVKEQRLSALFVSLLVGLSVLMSNLLRLVPMSVLFGVFLYMGVSSTSGVQFFDRLQLFFMPVKHHPRVPYVRRVQTYKMHLFTCVQLVALALLWVVKSSRASLAFPFFLIMMVPLRQKLAKIFSPEELQALDGKQPDGRTEDEPDFYEQAPLPG